MIITRLHSLILQSVSSFQENLDIKKTLYSLTRQKITKLSLIIFGILLITCTTTYHYFKARPKYAPDWFGRYFLKNDLGKMTFFDGNIYEGEFKNGQPNGKGKIIFSNGKVYIGEFKDEKGKFNHPDGSMLQVCLKNGNYMCSIEGPIFSSIPALTNKETVHKVQGTIHLLNGIVYEGEVEKGKPEGQGKIIMPSGNVWKGEFKKDNGEFEFNDANGKWVQKITFKNGMYKFENLSFTGIGLVGGVKPKKNWFF